MITLIIVIVIIVITVIIVIIIVIIVIIVIIIIMYLRVQPFHCHPRAHTLEDPDASDAVRETCKADIAQVLVLWVRNYSSAPACVFLCRRRVSERERAVCACARVREG